MGAPVATLCSTQSYSWRTNELDIVNTDWVIYSRICRPLEVPRHNGQWPPRSCEDPPFPPARARDRDI